MSDSVPVIVDMTVLERLAALADKIEGPVTIPNRLGFNASCQAVVDQYRSTGSAEQAIRDAWPFGKSHFYQYKDRCPELAKKWDAAKVEVARSRRKAWPELARTE